MKLLALLLVVTTTLAHAASPPPDAGKPTLLKGKYVIDVRSESEWQAGHIDGAILIPHDQIKARIGEVTKDKTAPIALYCRSGRRSGLALQSLKSLGYEHVENLGDMTSAKKTLAVIK